ncbi:MAG: hypothetical protein JWO33_821 [Caulobacteraceae bacterium]|nr:hypothetical protein [Caulobacteraceae bacterium]
MPDAGRQAFKFARTSYRGLTDLARAAVLKVPARLPTYARVWSVWGRDLRRFALVHPDRTFWYAGVPKAANSTIKRLLWRIAGVEIAEPVAQRVVHLNPGPYVALTDLGFDEREPVLTGPGVFRFSFVRNPYQRLRSAYLQKLLQPQAYEQPGYYLAALKWRSPRPPTFSEFVRAVVAQSDTQMNVHWMPQHRCLVLDSIPYDFIGRVERFEADIHTVLERLGASPALYEVAASVNRSPRQSTDMAFYTEETAALVFERYRRDFEAFGYVRDSYAAS